MPLPLRAAQGARGVRSRAPRMTVSATADAAAAPPPPQGVKWVPAIISIAVGLVVRYLVPIPVGVTVQAWQLLSIFLATVTGACHHTRVREEGGRGVRPCSVWRCACGTMLSQLGLHG
jgi:hypothetical protein